MIYNKLFQDEKRKADQIFYARNLNNADIEGSKPGTLISKVVKNKNLAESMKHTGSKCVQDNHLPDIRLNYPYGTVSNKDNWEELPLYLRKARNTKLRTGEDTTALKPYQMADPNNLRSGNTSSTQSETHHNKKHFPQGPGADFDRQLMSRNVIPNQT